MDSLTRAERSAVMARVLSKDTVPEMAVRRLVYAMGYRYRLHDRTLPGTPDIVFHSRRKVIFVSGCFWHRHRCRNGRRIPKSRVKFWETKFRCNMEADRRARRKLRRRGWEILVLWECQLNDIPRTTRRIRSFL